MAGIGTLCVLLTCYNRKEKSVACLRHLERSAALAMPRLKLRGVLVDDGSSDGTAAAVTTAFPWVTVLQSDGALYWNRGMHMAMAHAMLNVQSDAYLWLNDDTNLEVGAVQVLMDTADELVAKYGRTGLVVGSTRDPNTGELTYGGSVAASRLRRFAYRKVFDAQRAVPCQAFNGNVVLIPAAVAADVGNLDPEFEHAMGDIDYGLRASKRGHPVYVAPGYVGTCSNNPKTATFEDESLPLRRRMHLMLHRKGLPWRSWLVLTRRHGGGMWPIYFLWPYTRLVIKSIF